MNTLMDLRNSIRAAIDLKMQASIKKYSGGQCPDLATYKSFSGRTLGLVDARDIVDEVFNKFIDEGSSDD